MAHAFKDLAAWQAAHRLTLAVYKATEKYPAHERYSLVSQSRRAVFSAPLNIAEGSSRRSAADFRRFLDIAHSSLGELEYALILGQDLEYLKPEHWTRLEALRRQAATLTWRLMQAVTRRIDKRGPRT